MYGSTKQKDKAQSKSTKHPHPHPPLCGTGWLEERATSIYPNEAGYDPKASTVFSLDMDVPQELPDALRGESWCFVQLPLGALLEELGALPEVGGPGGGWEGLCR